MSLESYFFLIFGKLLPANREVLVIDFSLF